MRFKSSDLTPEMLARLPKENRQEPKPKATPLKSRMNKWEQQYATTLRLRQHAGEVRAFWFEPIKFRLARLGFYTPDFMVILEDWSVVFHEVKGHMREDANVKIKVAAEQFPFPFYLITKEKGQSGWTTTRVGQAEKAGG